MQIFLVIVLYLDYLYTEKTYLFILLKIEKNYNYFIPKQMRFFFFFFFLSNGSLKKNKKLIQTHKKIFFFFFFFLRGCNALKDLIYICFFIFLFLFS